MERDKNLENLIDTINNEMNTIEKERGNPIPSNTQILLSGLSMKTVGTTVLISPEIDTMIGTILDHIINGDFSKVEDGVNKIIDKLNNSKTSATERIVGNTLARAVTDSLNSVQFSLAKSKFKKANIILSNIKRQESMIDDPEKRKEYREAIAAIKKLYKLAIMIYAWRYRLSKKELRGFKNIIEK